MARAHHHRRFITATVSANGYYKKDEPVYVDMQAKGNLEDFDFDVNLMLTNDVLISNHADINIGKANVYANVLVPIKDIYASELSASVSDIDIAGSPLSLGLNLNSKSNNSTTSISTLKIENLNYNEFNIESLSYDISIDKNIKMASIKDSSSDEDMLAVDFYFDNIREANALILDAKGNIPIGFINNIADRNIIDPLTDVYIDYSIENVNNNLEHDLSVNMQDIITLDNILQANAKMQNNNIIIEDIVYNLGGTNAIKGSGLISIGSNETIKASMSIDTPIGLYEPSVNVQRQGERTEVSLSTKNNTLRGSGFISETGAFNFDISTDEKIRFNGFELGANIKASKLASDSEIDVGGEVDVRLVNSMVEFNAKSMVSYSDNKIMLTNIRYENRGYVLNGAASVSMADGLNTINLILQEPGNGAGLISSDIDINSKNINAKCQYTRDTAFFYTNGDKCRWQL